MPRRTAQHQNQNFMSTQDRVDPSKLILFAFQDGLSGLMAPPGTPASKGWGPWLRKTTGKPDTVGAAMTSASANVHIYIYTHTHIYIYIYHVCVYIYILLAHLVQEASTWKGRSFGHVIHVLLEVDM